MIGRLQTAKAGKALANLEVQRQVETVRSEVVDAHQAWLASRKTLLLTQNQLDASTNAYALSKAGLKAGTALP
jgi:outer membrane protein TolC